VTLVSSQSDMVRFFTEAEWLLTTTIAWGGGQSGTGWLPLLKSSKKKS